MKKLGSLSGPRWFTILATLGLALLSGHLMQLIATREAPWTETRSAIVPPVLPNVPSVLSPLPEFSERVLTTRHNRAGTCRPSLTLEETPNGELAVALDAPCDPHMPFKITVNALTADVETNATGRWSKRLPALAPEVSVSVRLGEDTFSKTLQHTRREARQLVALSWTGPQIFFIRARSTEPEGAEDVGAFTHVGSGAGAGFEIYSSPHGTNRGGRIVRLSVETQVTEATCGRHVSTRAFQTGYLGDLRQTEIAYTMPDCDRIGDVVRLQNLLRDMRLALR